MIQPTSTLGRECQQELRDAGKAYPRTCAVCGLGPCRRVMSSSPRILAVANRMAAELDCSPARAALAIRRLLDAGLIKLAEPPTEPPHP